MSGAATDIIAEWEAKSGDTKIEDWLECLASDDLLDDWSSWSTTCAPGNLYLSDDENAIAGSGDTMAAAYALYQEGTALRDDWLLVFEAAYLNAFCECMTESSWDTDWGPADIGQGGACVSYTRRDESLTACLAQRTVTAYDGTDSEYPWPHDYTLENLGLTPGQEGWLENLDLGFVWEWAQCETFLSSDDFYDCEEGACIWSSTSETSYTWVEDYDDDGAACVSDDAIDYDLVDAGADASDIPDARTGTEEEACNADPHALEWSQEIDPSTGIAGEYMCFCPTSPLFYWDSVTWTCVLESGAESEAEFEDVEMTEDEAAAYPGSIMACLYGLDPSGNNQLMSYSTYWSTTSTAYAGDDCYIGCGEPFIDAVQACKEELCEEDSVDANGNTNCDIELQDAMCALEIGPCWDDFYDCIAADACGYESCGQEYLLFESSTNTWTDPAYTGAGDNPTFSYLYALGYVLEGNSEWTTWTCDDTDCSSFGNGDSAAAIYVGAPTIDTDTNEITGWSGACECADGYYDETYGGGTLSCLLIPTADIVYAPTSITATRVITGFESGVSDTIANSWMATLTVADVDDVDDGACADGTVCWYYFKEEASGDAGGTVSSDVEINNYFTGQGDGGYLDMPAPDTDSDAEITYWTDSFVTLPGAEVTGLTDRFGGIQMSFSADDTSGATASSIISSAGETLLASFDTLLSAVASKVYSETTFTFKKIKNSYATLDDTLLSTMDTTDVEADQTETVSVSTTMTTTTTY